MYFTRLNMEIKNERMFCTCPVTRGQLIPDFFLECGCEQSVVILVFKVGLQLFQDGKYLTTSWSLVSGDAE